MGMTLQLLEEEGYTGEQFMADLGQIVIFIGGAVGALLALYAVYIGYLFATASDANKRTAAKDRLIKTIASMLIVIALTSILGIIEVRFDTVKGRIGGSDQGATYENEYSLKESVPTLRLEFVEDTSGIDDDGKWRMWYNCTGTIGIDVTKIWSKTKGDFVDSQPVGHGSTITLKQYEITKPNVDLYKNQIPVGQQLNTDQKSFKFHSLERPKRKDDETINVPCFINSDGHQVVRVAVGFTIGQNPTIQTLFVDAVVDISSNQGIAILRPVA